MLRILEDNIGFAVVKRRFESAGRIFLAGEELDRAFLLRMPRGNRDAMQDSKQIEIYPKAVESKNGSGKVSGELYMRAAGIGTYDVIQGKLVGTGLSKEDAQAMVDGGVAKPEKKADDAPKAKRVSAKRGKGKKIKTKRKAREPVATSAPPRADEPSRSDEANGPIL